MLNPVSIHAPEEANMTHQHNCTGIETFNNMTEQMLVNGTTNGRPGFMCNNTSLSDSIQMSNETLAYVLYSSNAERYGTIAMLSAIGILTIVNQGSIIATIIKDGSLHDPHFKVIQSLCIADGLHIFIYILHILPRFTSSPLPPMLSTISSNMTTLFIYLLVYHMGLLSYERYVYFCRPLAYENIFSTKRLYLMIMAIYMLSLAFYGLSTIVVGRTFRSSALLYTFQNSAAWTLIHAAFVLLPSSIMTIFCALRIHKVILGCQVAPVVPEGVVQPVVPVVQARKCMRMILLVSGAFWLTTIPSYVIWFGLIIAGYTWDDFDTRRYMAPAITTRISGLIYTLGSSVLNPYIFYCCIKDLRKALLRFIRAD